MVAFQVGRGNVAAPRPLASIYGEGIALECGKSACLADGSSVRYPPLGTLRFVPDVQRVAMPCPNHGYKRVRYGDLQPHQPPLGFALLREFNHGLRFVAVDLRTESVNG